MDFLSTINFITDHSKEAGYFKVYFKNGKTQNLSPKQFEEENVYYNGELIRKLVD